MYAFVRFLEDNTCCALPVANVRDLKPVHKRDFDEQKVYVVLRGEENGTGRPAKAHILALAGKFANTLLLFFFFFFQCLYLVSRQDNCQESD